MRASSFRRTLVALATHAHGKASRSHRGDFKYMPVFLTSRTAAPLSFRHMSSGAESSAEKEPVTVVIEPAPPKPAQPAVSDRDLIVFCLIEYS